MYRTVQRYIVESLKTINFVQKNLVGGGGRERRVMRLRTLSLFCVTKWNWAFWCSGVLQVSGSSPSRGTVHHEWRLSWSSSVAPCSCHFLTDNLHFITVLQALYSLQPLLTNKQTNKSIPWSRVPPSSPAVLQLAKQFPTFNETRRFITVFTRTRRMYLSLARWVQSTPSHPIYLNSTLILSYHLKLCLPSGLFHQGFPHQSLACISLPQYVLHSLSFLLPLIGSLLLPSSGMWLREIW